jgi:RNA polymerase sigma-70 factor (ECF subfamily)
VKEFVISSTNPISSAEEEFLNNELRCELLKGIQKLNPKHKIPIILFYFHDYSYDEIAEILKLPKGTIKSRLNSAKNKLKNNMEVSNV